MKKRFLWIILLTTILGLSLVSSLSQALSTTSTSLESFERSYTFDVQRGHFSSSYTLQVSIPPSLYAYYKSRSHVMSSDRDYVRYITPSVFKSVAENIQKITNGTLYSDEQFANAVLTLVRQIPYNISNVKYPIEAMVRNSGDCDVLSLLAASIMKAGGLDVVLFEYKNLTPSHMNIGVYLPHKPVYRSWWITPVGFEYNNKTYWIAEATPLGQWKVGERPDLVANSKAYIIPLNDSQKTSPGQISSSLDPLLPSGISVTLSSDNSNITEYTRSLTVSGAISPALPNKTVTMYISQNKITQTFQTKTDQSGKYSFNWTFKTTATYQIQTSCSDIANFTAADSDKLTVFGSYRPPITDYSPYFPSDIPKSENSDMAGYVNFINQGFKEFLKSSVSGTGALLSGEFIVLNNNLTETQYEPIIIQRVEIIGFSRNRMPIQITVPVEILPPIIPNGQLGFILQENGDNEYDASVRILEDQAVSEITTQLNEEAAFMNASQITKENTWYRITATMSEAATNATLYEENGTTLNNVTPKNNTVATNQTGVVLSYSPGAVLAFRNLKVETLDKTTMPQTSESQTLEKTSEPPTLFIELASFLIVAVVAIALVKRKVRRKK